MKNNGSRRLDLEIQTHFMKEDLRKAYEGKILMWESPELPPEIAYEFWKEVMECPLCKEALGKTAKRPFQNYPRPRRRGLEPMARRRRGGDPRL